MRDPRPRKGEGARSEVSPPTITPVLVADLLAEGERMPVYVHVIDHPDARVLVDTGMTQLHPAVADMDPRLIPTERAGRLRPGQHRRRHQHPPALRPLRRQPPVHRQADLRPAPGARRRAQRERLHDPRVGRGARPAATYPSTARSSCCRGSGSSRRQATPEAPRWSSSRGRACSRRRRRHGGLLRRARRAAHRGPAAGPRPRPSRRSGSRTSTSRGGRRLTRTADAARRERLAVDRLALSPSSTPRRASR